MLIHFIIGDVNFNLVKVISAKFPYCKGTVLPSVIRKYLMRRYFEIRFFNLPFFQNPRNLNLSDGVGRKSGGEELAQVWPDLSLCVYLSFSFCTTERIMLVM